MSPLPMSPDPHDPRLTRPMLYASWHSLAWLVFANAVGVLLALLLLVPRLNDLLQPLTYGRWMPVHINLQLYGWCSLPLVAFLFHVYQADHLSVARGTRPVLWIWSTALAVGAASWLTGHSSGKLFLDWTGYARTLFPAAMLALWLLLCIAMWRSRQGMRSVSAGIKVLGLAVLLAVPFLVYFAADPGFYPPINPDTGGPTGASQLESTLVIVAILLLLPYGLTQRKQPSITWPRLAWIVFAAEVFLCAGLGRADVSHHRPTQFISLGSLLVWIPLIPAYYNAFIWHANTRRWRVAFLAWWSVLIPTGWCLFLPGVLDHFKFTDGLVGHSLLAMAGFVSSLLIFVMVQLLGEDGWIFNATWSFYVWHAAVVVYVGLMFFSGWREGADPSFALVPGLLRNSIYALRLVLGLLLFVSSAEWLVAASSALHQTQNHVVLEEQPA